MNGGVITATVTAIGTGTGTTTTGTASTPTTGSGSGSGAGTCTASPTATVPFAAAPPVWLTVNPDNIPATLRDKPRWVVWRSESREGKVTKVPHRAEAPTKKASTAAPGSWTDFATAMNVHMLGKADGIGIVLNGDGLVGIDIDGCVEPATGDINAEAAMILNELDSYAELTPSGGGVRVFVTGTLPEGRRVRQGHDHTGVEAYSDKRFLTVTGRHLPGTPTTINERSAALQSVHRMLFDTSTRTSAAAHRHHTDLASDVTDGELLQRARMAQNGAHFIALYDSGDTTGYASQSEADLALCSHLAYWTRADVARIDALFRKSRLMRAKWDEPRGDSTYGTLTIQKAISGRTDAWHEAARSAAESHAVGAHVAVRRIAPNTTQQSAMDDSVGFATTDTGNAEWFAARYKTMVRFDHAAQLWRVWQAPAWVKDRDGGVGRMAKDAVRARLEAAAAIGTDQRRLVEVKWAYQSESRTRLGAMLSLARNERPLAVTGDEWDQNPMLLAVQNGVIDLETGRLRRGEPEDMVTRVAPVIFTPGAACPRWNRFMREIFLSHPELADYMQRVIGYTLTGMTTEQALWILFGTGANGKSTLIETVIRMFGRDDLAWTMPFPSASWSDSMSEYQKAELAGRRLVTSSEVSKQGRLNEELIKSLTGGDTINARHPYGRPFQFVPAAKFYLRVNEKPQIRDESHGMWRRLKLVPFAQTFSIDTTLSDVLATELPGILQWALLGCRDWQREGLCEPSVVNDATAEYRDEQDQTCAFLSACCIETEAVRVKAGALFEAYKSWANDNVSRPEDRLTQFAFGRRMRARFKALEGRNVVYLGVGLSTDAGQD